MIFGYQKSFEAMATLTNVIRWRHVLTDTARALVTFLGVDLCCPCYRDVTGYTILMLRGTQTTVVGI